MHANYPRVGVGVFVWKNDKFLMIKRQGSHGAGTWSIPGGGVEFSESWEETAKREVLEEVGIEITNVRTLAFTNDVFEGEGKHYLTVWLQSDLLGDDPKIMEPNKITQLEWHDFKSLPAPLFEPCWSNLRLAKPELFL